MMLQSLTSRSEARPSVARRMAGLAVTAGVALGMLMVGAAPASAAPLSPGGTMTVYDEFSRTVSSGLSSSPIGGAYSSYGAKVLSVDGASAVVKDLQPGDAVGSSLPQSSLNATVQTSILVPTVGAQGSDFYFALEARKQADGSAYRGRVKVAANGALSLSFSRTAVSTETVLGKFDLPFTLPADQRMHLQFQVTGTNPVLLQSRAWIDPAVQPDWQYELTDAVAARISTAGNVGFWAYTSSSSNPATFALPALRADSLPGTVTSTPPPPQTPVTPTAPVKPNASNTGVPAGTVLTTYTGPLTITVDGTVIDSKAVYGDLRIQAKNVVIRNSYLHGGSAIPSSNTGCIDANSASNYNLTITHNTIIPDHPSYYRDGIVGHEFTATGNHISRSNDGIGIFNRPGGSLNANVTVKGNYIHSLTHWNNDPAHSDGTHNDGIQLQGGQNILISGNNVVGSVVAGDGLGVFGLHGGSALLAKQGVSKFENLVIKDNWFDDAQNSVCINNGSWSVIALTFQNNAFGRHQYNYGNNSTYQIRIYVKAASQVTGLATNKWEDTNKLLTEGRDTGIRYNA